MEFVRKLPIPMEVKEMYPLTASMEAIKEKTDIEIKKVFTGKSDRFLLIIGPCSADREDAVIDYVMRLREVQEKVADKILIIQGGRITEEGTHDELVAKKGYYYSLVQLQTGEEV